MDIALKGDGITTSILNIVSQQHNLRVLAQELQLDLPFLCQIDEQTHSALESAYRCDKCDMYICSCCYTALATVVNLTACHHCQDTLVMVLGLDYI